MERVADLIAPGQGIAGAVAALEDDPARSIEGIDNLLAWLQDLTDRTLDDLDGAHFDIPEPLRRIECCEAPPGSSEAIYYTAPSTDFSRPGRTWHPAHGRTRFPLWTEVTTAYHEGAPGHHLQIGLCMTFGDRLTRFQRLLGRYPGHSEGWALYAERLMEELGYLERPDYLLGMLSAQAFRAMRVVVDIGLHLQLEIPRTEPYAPGRVWDWDLALPFVNRYIGRDAAFATSELVRYCGMPGTGDLLQGRRAGVARHPITDARPAGCSLRPEAIPHGRAQPRVAPSRRPAAGVARGCLRCGVGALPHPVTSSQR